MGTIKRVVEDAGARALANLLNGTERRRPIVVVTMPTGRIAPWIDAERINDEVGDLAEVFLMTSGPHTRTFSAAMPDLTQVYGGAGRVYPLGHDWVADPRQSPLRFAYDAEEGARSTDLLIGDAMRMVRQVGAAQRPRTAAPRRASGVVKGFSAGRAWVAVDGGFATVAQELTLPDVPLERILAKGMRVEGLLDEDSRRLDVRRGIGGARDALAAYAVGDLVLASVAEVGPRCATLKLHPHHSTVVQRDQISGNDQDDPRSLLTAGEVVVARVLSTGPGWDLSLLDVDDDEEVRPAPALIPGGPAWLVLAEPAEIPSVPIPVALPRPRTEPDPMLRPAVAGPAPIQRTSSAPKPSALGAAPRLAAPAPAPAAPASANDGAVAQMSLTIQSLRTQLDVAKARVADLEAQVRDGERDRTDLVELRRDQAASLDRKEAELKNLRGKLLKANRAAQKAAPAPSFADPALAFRHAVVTAWATRIPVAEQAQRPLPDFDLGPEFLTSLGKVPDVPLDKVADVAVEILTGLVHQLNGRDLHQLRTGDGGGSPYVRRDSDGASCWRAALQVNTPQARRIHYWRLPGGRIEFSRVALHDQFEA
ncbi:MAG: hypothetical protein ACT4QG_21470 [Sporichthyaceae bacterium]